MSKTICLCKGVTEETIVEAIKQGNTTFEKVQEATGAGTGFCNTGRCKANILELIEKNK